MEQIAITIDASSKEPKYLQIVEEVKGLIKTKALQIGSPLPSIRQICLTNNLSQETVLKAYSRLKELGIIEARERQGYFVQTDRVNHRRNVFLLFDELSEYKKILYNTIREGLGHGSANVKIFFHHCDVDVFESLLLNNIHGFDMFVVMPFDNRRIPSILEKLQGRNVVLLDRRENFDANNFNFIVQDFDTAVYSCLKLALAKIKRYKSFTLVFPETDSVASNAFKAPKDIKKAFVRFCIEFDVPHKIVSEVKEVKAGQAFFFIDDTDMVNVIDLTKRKNLELGWDLGILSYNDFPLKRVVGKGITVISTDFAKMGEELVNHVLSDSKTVKSVIATKLILRSSL